MQSVKWNDLSVLVDALAASLKDGAQSDHPRNAREAVNAMLRRGSVECDREELTKEGAAAFFSCVIQAYAAKTFKTKNLICGPLAHVVHWYLTQISDEKARCVWDVLLTGSEYNPSKLTVKKFALKKPMKAKVQQAHSPDIRYLVNLLSLDQLSGKEMDAVVDLVQMAACKLGVDVDAPTIDDDELSPKFQTVKSILSSKALLELFLDPLTVKSTRDERPSLLDITREAMTGPSEVLWTDGRSDVTSGGDVH